MGVPVNTTEGIRPDWLPPQAQWDGVKWVVKQDGEIFFISKFTIIK